MSSSFREEIENSPILNILNKNIDFTAGVLAGTITPVVKDDKDPKINTEFEQTQDKQL